MKNLPLVILKQVVAIALGLSVGVGMAAAVSKSQASPVINCPAPALWGTVLS